MSVELLINRNVIKVSNKTTIQEAARIMDQRKIGSLLIETFGQIVGIITETDIVRKATANGIDLKKETVEKIMSRPLVSLEQTRSPQDAFDLMGDAGVRHLAITDHEKIIGILSVRDLLVYFKKQSEPQMGID